MSDIAINVDGLGKKYQIGGRQKSYYRLTDQLVDTIVAPFRRARNLMSGQAGGAADLHETIWALENISFQVKAGQVVGIPTLGAIDPESAARLNSRDLVRVVRGRLWATAENRRRISGYKSMYADTAPGWVAARKALKTMGALCRERGVPLVVAIFPLFGNPMDDGYPFPEIHAKVSEAASEAGARVVDLLPAYRGVRWELLVVDGVDDEHPNEIAHRIAAGVILHALDDVVPWSPGRSAPAEIDNGGPPS